jgi:hypothetical protein
MIIYANFSVSIHGTELKTEDELSDLALKIQALVAKTCKNTEVEIEITEHAGEEE